jgi:hypothetical protein
VGAADEPLGAVLLAGSNVYGAHSRVVVRCHLREKNVKIS